LLKKGQLLLKQSLLNKSEQNKRTLHGEINNVIRTDTSEKNATTTQQQKKESVEKTDLMKKFSFLNRDKSYLSRLSTYVNKNFAGHSQHLSIGNAGGDFTGTVKPVSCIKPRTNNMVFSTLHNLPCADETTKSANNTKVSRILLLVILNNENC